MTDILHYWPTGQFARSLNLFLTSPLSNTHSLSLDNSCSIPVHTSLSACDHTDHRRGTGPLPGLPSYNGWQIPATLLIFLPLLRRQPAVFVKKIMVKSFDCFFFCVSAQETMAKSGDCFCSDKRQLSLYRKQCLKVVIVSVSAQMEASCLYTEKNG